ncbi:hypothetical protein ONZ43_g7168 [Nemania bipapillata]|uniref:Uncharacterized protein n=1 Tax=Nemania bipapillata TaxID=110536 RepID=A0ACC2HSS1_9PEZI|nr:hypothetical protein ONZ43_g7168 [Nemania bipapillata]
MTLIDRDKFTGNENDLFMYQQPSHSSSSSSSQSEDHHSIVPRGGQAKKKSKDTPKGQTSAVASSLLTGGYFAKVDLYANSRLPFDLPSFRVPIPVYPLLCLAAHYSERVYEKPRGAERDAHVEANWKTGAKAMYIKSVPMDDMGTIVFAIRGTATFMDWAVNLNTAPTAPTGFLDDAGNFCHAGFLSVARKMIAPVATRLRHSAGGAIASLLYMHMLATSKAASSELNLLTGCFKRIHCVTFVLRSAKPHAKVKRTKTVEERLDEGVVAQFANDEKLRGVIWGDPVCHVMKLYAARIEVLAVEAVTAKGL